MSSGSTPQHFNAAQDSPQGGDPSPQRTRLVQLLGRLLARYWLRRRVLRPKAQADSGPVPEVGGKGRAEGFLGDAAPAELGVSRGVVQDGER
jgi:hypothetical protein